MPIGTGRLKQVPIRPEIGAVSGEEDTWRPKPREGGGTARIVWRTGMKSTAKVFYEQVDPAKKDTITKEQITGETEKDADKRRFHEVLFQSRLVDSLFAFYVQSELDTGRVLESGVHYFHTGSEIETSGTNIQVFPKVGKSRETDEGGGSLVTFGPTEGGAYQPPWNQGANLNLAIREGESATASTSRKTGEFSQNVSTTFSTS